jgi:pimeloyl-ACP methyl ester carboxylesterase
MDGGLREQALNAKRDWLSLTLSGLSGPRCTPGMDLAGSMLGAIMQTASTMLYMLPGLAADARLFEPQKQVMPQLQTPAWIMPIGRERLETYAKRMAQALQTARESSGQRGRYFVGGFSFGGQVALEMVQHLSPKPSGVVLICGVRSRAQILPDFERQQRMAGLVPAFVQRLMYGPYAKHFAKQERLSEEHTALLVGMAKANDPAFLNWSSWACATWEGKPKGVANEPGENGVVVHHLHGECDSVIPDVRKQATKTLAAAGHLVTFTHAEAVTAWLQHVVQ